MHCCGSEANAPPHLRIEVIIRTGAIEIHANKAWRLARRDLEELAPADNALPLVTPWDKPPRRRLVVRRGRLEEER
jgi:hypothetical protein